MKVKIQARTAGFLFLNLTRIFKVLGWGKAQELDVKYNQRTGKIEIEKI